FESPTIAAFAAAIGELSSEPQARMAPPIVPVARERRIALPDGEDEGFVLPASFAEQRLWFLDRLEPDSTAYNVPLAVRLRGDLDVGAMERAISALKVRHESLRTRFALVDGEPKQVITPPAAVSLTLRDLSA